MRIRWHVPNFVTGSVREGETFEFSSPEELLANPNVASLMDQDFDRWEIAPSISGREPALMRITKDRRCLPVGFLSMDHHLPFPDWKRENYPPASSFNPAHTEAQVPVPA